MFYGIAFGIVLLSRRHFVFWLVRLVYQEFVVAALVDLCGDFQHIYGSFVLRLYSGGTMGPRKTDEFNKNVIKTIFQYFVFNVYMLYILFK